MFGSPLDSAVQLLLSDHDCFYEQFADLAFHGR